MKANVTSKSFLRVNRKLQELSYEIQKLTLFQPSALVNTCCKKDQEFCTICVGVKLRITL